jgi:hypothetical protein
MQHAPRQSSFRRAAGIGALVVGSLAAHAEAPVASAHPAVASTDPRMTWTAQPLTVYTGDEGRMGVDLALPVGFHVFKDDIQILVVDDGGLTLGAPVLPAPHPAGEDRAAPWYEEGVHIEVPVVTAGVVPGVHLVQLQAEVRGCSARRCHAGTQESLEVYVQVVDRDEAACPR